MFSIYSGYKSLIRSMICKYFLPFYHLSFYFTDVSFKDQNIIIQLSPIYLFLLLLLVILVYLKKALPNLRS